MVYYSTDNHVYETENLLGKGGEATIYSVKGYPELAAKIYHNDKRTIERRKKAHVMSQLTVSDYFHDSVALPLSVLYENSDLKDGFSGYVMPRVKDITELQDIYYQNTMNQYQKTVVASNLCIMTNLVHDSGQVIGDFNSKNIAINSYKGTGVLIDTDSFHITVKNSKGKLLTFPCTMAVEVMVAPELRAKLKNQRATLEDIQGESFSKETDLYALAIHLFSLLMNGANPFRASVNMADMGSSHVVSSVTIDQFEAANKGEFLFAKRIFGKKLPEDVPDFNILSKDLQELFTRCFVDGAKDPKARPTAKEYYYALEQYKEMLKKQPCGHYLRKDYNKPCEFCRLNRLSE